jgi:hypothetical protein
MNLSAILFLLVAAIALLAVPRRWAPLPLLAGACYMTLAQGVEVGPFNFTLLRLLIFVGGIRAVARGERPAGGLTRMDGLLLIWAAWALIASGFHENPQETLINRLGMVYNVLGTFFLIRCFCQSREDVVGIIYWTAIILVPVALEMVLEQVTHRNFFAIFGGVDEMPALRQGRLRSQGPFAHAILAGTVGATCLPLMIGLWRKHRLVAQIGLVACLLMVLASASSGPLASMIFGLAVLGLWRWRHRARQLWIAAVIGYILLDLIMKAPAYYLIARVDLVGGSTGRHRAALIQAAIEHLDEWWWAGTDYTRHWMPYGVSWSKDHADITNHYLGQGVRGGLPLMLLFIFVLGTGFHNVGRALRRLAAAPVEDRFLVWSLGGCLLAHAATATSVAYFDQSVMFIYLTLALTVSLSVGPQTGWAGDEASPAPAEGFPEEVAFHAARFGQGGSRF